MPDLGRLEAWARLEPWAWLLQGVYWAIVALGGTHWAAVAALLCGIQGGWLLGRRRRESRHG